MDCSLIWWNRFNLCQNKKDRKYAHTHKHTTCSELQMKRSQDIVLTKSKWPGTGWSAGAEPEEPEVEEPKLRQCPPPDCGTCQGPGMMMMMMVIMMMMMMMIPKCGTCQVPLSRLRRRQASAASSPPVGLALSRNYQEGLKINQSTFCEMTHIYMYYFVHILRDFSWRECHNTVGHCWLRASKNQCHRAWCN